MPMTIFMDNGFHIRARDGRALIAWPGPEEPGEPDELKADDAWIETVERMAYERVPVLRDFPVDRSLSYAGLYEMSPDHHVILGASPTCDNVFFANGSSGHGVMHSPAIGEIVADMILGKEPQLDVSMLRPSRFDEGEPVTPAEFL
jgi:sarcosine oxidase subunit beta